MTSKILASLAVLALLSTGCDSLEITASPTARASASISESCLISAAVDVTSCTRVVSSYRVTLAVPFDPASSTITVYTSVPVEVVTDFLDASTVSVTFWNEAGNATALDFDLVVEEW